MGFARAVAAAARMRYDALPAAAHALLDGEIFEPCELLVRYLRQGVATGWPRARARWGDG